MVDEKETESLRFSNPKMALNLRDSKEHINKKLPCGWIIDGGFGEGKTGVADAIGEYYESLYGCEFDPVHQIGMGGNKFVEAFDWCKKNGKHVCVYDEAADYGRVGGMSRFNKLITTMLSKSRSSEILILFIIYSVRKLDQSMLEAGFIQGTFHCFGKVQDKYTYVKAYDANSTYYLIGRMNWLRKNNVAPNNAYSDKQVHSAFKTLVYPPSAKHQKLIDKMSNLDKDNDIESTAMALNGFVNLAQIVKRSGYSSSTFNKWLAVNDVESKHVGKRKYYPESIIDLFVSDKKKK